MRKLLLIGLGALALAACNTTGGLGGIPTSPAEVANKTVLDEKAGIAAETLYTGAAKAAALSIRLGVVTDANTIRRIGELDNQAKALLQKVRDAYDAGNAAGYDAAFRQLNDTVLKMLMLSGK